MTVAQLDYFFPFIVLFYGLVMTVILSIPQLVHLGREKMPADQWNRFESHKGLGLVCLIIGGLWSLQNLWLL